MVYKIIAKSCVIVLLIWMTANHTYCYAQASTANLSEKVYYGTKPPYPLLGLCLHRPKPTGLICEDTDQGEGTARLSEKGKFIITEAISTPVVEVLYDSLNKASKVIKAFPEKIKAKQIYLADSISEIIQKGKTRQQKVLGSDSLKLVRRAKSALHDAFPKDSINNKLNSYKTNIKAIAPLIQESVNQETQSNKLILNVIDEEVKPLHDSIIDKKEMDPDKELNAIAEQSDFYKEAFKNQPESPIQSADNMLKKLPDPNRALNKEQIKHIANEQAKKYLAMEEMVNRLPQLNASQQQFASYKKRMAWLKEGTGLKPNSLKEEPLSNRIVWGTNFQLKNLNPFGLSMAPYIAYRLTKKVSTGISFVHTSEVNVVGYKQLHYSEVSSGYRLFTDYKLVNSFFAHAELEGLSNKAEDPTTEFAKRKWAYKGYLGVRRSLSLYKNLRMNMYFLVDLTHKDLLSLPKDAFQVRIGLGGGKN